MRLNELIARLEELRELGNPEVILNLDAYNVRPLDGVVQHDVPNWGGFDTYVVLH